MRSGAHPHPDVGVAALVAAARPRDRAQRRAPGLAEWQRFGQRERRDGFEHLGLGGRGDVGARAVGVHRDVGHQGGVDVARGEHAVHLTVAPAVRWW